MFLRYLDEVVWNRFCKLYVIINILSVCSYIDLYGKYFKF